MGFSRGFRFGLYGIAVFILAAGMYALAKPSVSGAIPPASDQDHTQGNPTATVSIIEYSDFQCPACRAFQPVVQDILTTYGDKIQFTYRHFPLFTLHPNAQAAALASEAAAQQGKFWEMHDMLFDRQTDWENLTNTDEIFSAYAGLLALNVDQFKANLTSSAVRDRVKVDVNSGNAAGISSTPTFYLNGVALSFPKNENPLVYFKAQIDAALAAAPTAQTTPGPDVTATDTTTQETP